MLSIKLGRVSCISKKTGQILVTSCSKRFSTAVENEVKDDDAVVHDFQPLVLYPKFTVFAKAKRAPMKQRPIMPPRSVNMSPDQDWGDVWPTARSFHPATVPLPVRMGFPASNQPTPDKWGNAELMKIPNFLHLTPPVVQRHCAAIRKFCTPWPEGVSYSAQCTTDIHFENDEEHQLKLKKSRKSKAYFSTKISSEDETTLPKPGDAGYFPCIKTKTSYLYSGPSIRDIRARIVIIKFQIEDLNLSDHSRDKLLRLLGDRFEPATNTVTLTVDRCPLYTQNLDYAHYLMTVLRAEAEKEEPWEHEKTRADMSSFDFKGSSSESAVERMRKTEKGLKEEDVEKYQSSLNNLLNVSEDEDSVAEYSASVLRMYGLTPTHDKRTNLNPLLAPDFDATLPPINIKHLQSWFYQERKKVVWISHSWPRFREWW